MFKNTSKVKEVVTDLAGNTFLTRQAVARLFGCSLPTLATTYKRKGLRPLDRYVKGYKVYLLDDVEQMYNRRAAYFSGNVATGTPPTLRSMAIDH